MFKFLPYNMAGRANTTRYTDPYVSHMDQIWGHSQS